MTQQTILKLISGGFGLSLIVTGLVLVLTGNGGAQSETLIAAGLGLMIAGVGVTTLPRLNEPPIPPSRKDSGPKPPLGPTLLALLAIGASVTLTSTACAGPPRAARIGLERGALGSDELDVLVAREVASAGGEFRAEVALEARDGRLAERFGELAGRDCLGPLSEGAQLECLVTAGIARLRELLSEHWTATVRDINRGIGDALEAAELALDAWTAGADTAASFFEKGACIVAGLAQVIRLLERQDVEIPRHVAAAVDILGSLALGVCPRPPGMRPELEGGLT